MSNVFFAVLILSSQLITTSTIDLGSSLEGPAVEFVVSELGDDLWVQVKVLVPGTIIAMVDGGQMGPGGAEYFEEPGYINYRVKPDESRDVLVFWVMHASLDHENTVYYYTWFREEPPLYLPWWA